MVSQEEGKLKEFILLNEGYIKHLAGLCKCFYCYCRHCRCEFSMKSVNNIKPSTDYKSRYRNMPHT